LAHCNYGQPGHRILQPGVADGGDYPENIIAELLEYVTLDFGGRTNKVDAALATPINEDDLDYTIKDVGKPNGTVIPEQDMELTISGRTSGVQSGTIYDNNWQGYITYRNGMAWFNDQIVVQNMGAPGDSGSIAVSNQNRVAGELFAGSPAGGWCILNKIQNTISALGITIPTDDDDDDPQGPTDDTEEFEINIT